MPIIIKKIIKIENVNVNNGAVFSHRTCNLF